MESQLEVQSVLATYPQAAEVERIEALGSGGGFSGARLWRLHTADGPLCLRCWPSEHPSLERLQYIHAVLTQVLQAGLEVVPAPLPSRAGRSYVQQAGRLWELTRWLPGRADYRLRPSPTRLAAAVETLAKFHVAAAGFVEHPIAASKAILSRASAGETGLANAVSAPARPRQPSPGLAERVQQLRKLELGGYRELLAAVRHAPWPELTSRALRILTLSQAAGASLREQWQQLAGVSVPLQPCLRDVWHDHILFTGDEVTGLIDFGALRSETVAGDVARLLGSLVLDDDAAWQFGLAAYQKIRPLSADELQLVRAFDQSTTVLSGVNWLAWIYRDARQFSDWQRIVARWDEILLRLQHLAALPK